VKICRFFQHWQHVHLCQHNGALWFLSTPYITNEVISNLYLLQLIMEHIIPIQLWLLHSITMASISRSNSSVNNIRSHTTSQLAEHATMYSASFVLGAMLNCSLLCHEVMDDPKLKQHPEVPFLSETIPAQSESVYPYNLKP
jgi:hypothetical protein